jgi:two-component system chemotaxis response regulator CheY
VTASTTAKTPSAEDDRAPRLLVVDDATVVRLYYRQILERHGYRVEDAINGLEGMEKALRTTFRLCIVDVNMPLMDGHAFLRALRRDPLTRGVPALMTSTEAGLRDRRMALAAGANAYLVKPVGADQLALHVAAMLGGGVA